MSKLSISVIRKDGLSNLIDEQNFYSDPGLLLKICPGSKLLAIKNGDEIIALSILPNSKYSFSHIYYYGMTLTHHFFKSARHNQIKLITDIFYILCEYFDLNVDKFKLSFHSRFYDLRGVQFYNYDNNNSAIKIVPRYTHILNIEGRSFESLSEEFRSARRQEINYAHTREQLFCDELADHAPLVKLYIESLERQDVSPSSHDIETIEFIIQELKALNLQHCIIGIWDKTRNLKSCALVFKDRDQTIHVPVVGNAKTKYGGTLLYAEIIKWAIEKNGLKIDFNGSNSPKRAYFKESFGGHSQLYFELVKD